MRYLHTMVRVSDVDQSLDFYCNKLGLVETRRVENEKGRFTLIFLAAPDDLPGARETKAPLMELTYNWNPETYGAGRNFGHLAFEVDDIYATCQDLMDKGVTINRPPPPTIFPSNFCRREKPRRRPSRGPRCRIPAAGRIAPT